MTPDELKTLCDEADRYATEMPLVYVRNAHDALLIRQLTAALREAAGEIERWKNEAESLRIHALNQHESKRNTKVNPIADRVNFYPPPFDDFDDD